MIEQQFKKGTLEMLILSIISNKPTYGYELVNVLSSSSNIFENIKEGTLYPILYRLEEDKLIFPVASIVNGRKKNTYTITEKGKAELSRIKNFWNDYKDIVDKILGDQYEKK